MKKTTAELTEEYIGKHPYIKNCLKKGLINYSSLARLIAKELNIEKKTSKEAILVAARRMQKKLCEKVVYEKKIIDLLAKSEMDIKNKINVFILSKDINLDYVDEIQKDIRNSVGTFYCLEGSDNYTIITQEKHSCLIKDKFESNIIVHNKDMVLINIKSPKEIEETTGVVSYLTNLFAENGVNIVEFFSCWTDTLFVISSRDLGRTIDFLKV
ncbi:MAG: hypothetical protein KAR87_00110 [Candidatus Aenigmarchaeota archaeon]|nr:hypothetical protein [Candidatus Aenigmarchaeota archaeon]